MSSRIGMAVVMGYLLRRKREADPPHAVYLGDLPAPPSSFGDAHRERDILDDIADETAQIITDEHIENRLRETLRHVGAEPAPEAPPEPEAVTEPLRRHRCGYPVGSVGCRNTCGEGAA